MNKNRKTRGYSLLIVLMILPLIAIAGFGMLNAVETETLLARHDVMKFRAELLAEDALNRYLAEETVGEEFNEKAELYRFEITANEMDAGRVEVISLAMILRPHGDYPASLRAVVERENGEWQIVEMEF